MKKITWNGDGNLLLPDQKDALATGESVEISDKLAETIVAANPGLDITVEDAPEKSGK